MVGWRKASAQVSDFLTPHLAPCLVTVRMLMGRGSRGFGSFVDAVEVRLMLLLTLRHCYCSVTWDCSGDSPCQPARVQADAVEKEQKA